MRNQTLEGFALHQRRYRERSYILHFFSHNFGRVDGVIRQHPPSLYHFANLQANGKSELKNFTQLDVQGQPFYLQHKALFAGFYLNELLIRLLACEEPMPNTYAAYVRALEQLKTLPAHDAHDMQLKLILRQFEHVFLIELGYAVDYLNDSLGHSLNPECYYVYVPQEGFVIDTQNRGYCGQDLIELGQSAQINSENMALVAKLQRTILNELLGHKPLKSRQLWVSQQQQT